MEKRQFKAESQRMLDLMINSIYTHKEIFLRELISNASDAIDKLAYRALTDDSVGLNRSDFKIVLSVDKDARTLTISDNGIGMTAEEMEADLGTIAKSGSLQFKQEMAAKEGVEDADVDIIGQFGVGFYSAFMVADRIEVLSRAFGSEQAYLWESAGADGYTITEASKDSAGTDIVLHIKEDGEEEQYSQYLDKNRLSRLVKKYSDYIHYPITMLMDKSRQKPKPEDAGDDDTPEWEDYQEWETLNSMVPLWQKKKEDVTEEEYNSFYTDKFGDWEKPLANLRVSVEGNVTYDALLYIPGRTPYDFYTRDYKKGLQLYSSGVLIMDNCADLLPEHFRFVKGVVDTPDVSLNISREMLQHTRQLKVIAKNLEKKIKAELLRIQKEDREKYRQFWKSFGLNVKYGAVADYGMNKDKVLELLMFASSQELEGTTLQEYKDRMPESQEFIYYAAGEDAAQLGKLPQAERILDKGYEILYLTDEVDEFVMQAIGEFDGKKLKSINDEDALPETEEEKKAAEEKAQSGKEVLDFLKETLGGKIKEARISKILKSHAVCMTSDGPMSIEMEKYMKRQGADMAGMQAERVLEINPDSEAYAALKTAVEQDKEKAKIYAEVLYNQALLIAGLPIEDPAAYTDLICGLLK
ncbi:MAG TPA: molecular chaperone HtpG [Candidatus Onthomonas avicola]|nr:molecular chaperone HtpG [Candidatus Onthomonas avicola]